LRRRLSTPQQPTATPTATPTQHDGHVE
jgi:hypothetical protein